MSSVDTTESVDLVVIGGGPGGYTAAIRAAQLGLDVTLVDDASLGGTCLNHGCIPSKALLSVADIVHQARAGEEKGIYSEITIDYERVLSWKDSIVDQLTGGVAQLCQANGVTLEDGRATFISDTQIQISAPEASQPKRINFEHAIIAVGSRPVEIPGFDFESPHVLDSRQALSLTDLPDQLLIVGAGYIGMELSTAFAKLGVDVSVIEAVDEVLPRYGNELTDPVAKKAETLGIDVHLGQPVKEWEATADGIAVYTETNDGDRNEFQADKVLVAVGRTPIVETVDPQSVGIQITEDEYVETDDQMRTSVDHIFAVGDVAGQPLLAHAAINEAQVAAETIAGQSATTDSVPIPETVFTDPEIATVGMTEKEVREEGYQPLVGRFPFRANGRMLTMGDTEGFVKLVFDQDSRILLGAQVVGAEASELIAGLSLAVSSYMTLSDISQSVMVHPTLSEAVIEAAQQADGSAIHTHN